MVPSIFHNRMIITSITHSFDIGDGPGSGRLLAPGNSSPTSVMGMVFPARYRVHFNNPVLGGAREKKASYVFAYYIP